MKALLLDTNIVSILFKPDRTLHAKCFGIVVGNEWLISFLTRAELLLWPNVNSWGPARRAELSRHVDLCTALLPDERTCAVWAEIIAESRAAGRSIATADAWVAATARQWGLALVTADYRDFQHLAGLTPIAVN